MSYYDLDKSQSFLISQKALIVEDGRVLLLKEVSQEKWELPGGLLEMTEDLATGLQREVFEEIGFEIVVGNPIAICDLWVPGFIYRDDRVLDTRVVVVTYLCVKIGGSAHLSHEHTDFMWAAPSNLASLKLSPDCASALQTYFAMLSDAA